MAFSYSYALSRGVDTQFRHINIAEADHFKQFLRQISVPASISGRSADGCDEYFLLIVAILLMVTRRDDIKRKIFY
ncbi:Uncharacterised protein [Escherichia coli]|uniref:Uncharacterized protein n=1 Tax=Escherichia coli TaxID=562 RepID=A0AAX2KJA8_ECOLX|nr:Uncharacterised protein [Escherichia coli]